MKNNKQLLLALALAFSSFAAHAANLDIRLPDNLVSAPPNANGSGNTAALMTATPATAPTAPAAPVAQPVQTAKPAAAPLATVVAPPAKPAAAVAPQAPAKPAAPAIATPAPVVKPAAVQAPMAPVAKPAAAAPQSQSVAEPSKIVVGFGNDKAAPAPAPAPTAAPAATSAVANVANPFTGKALSLESRQRSIEEAKLDTDLLNERLKQATMLADLTYMPIKKQAEVASLPNVQKVQTKDAAAPAAKEAAPAAAKKITKTKKKAASKDAAPATPVVAVPADPVLTVSSISINGRNASIVLEAQGNVMSARHGESTPFGTVQVIDSRTVMVGGRQLKVRDAVISRMVVSDPTPVDPKSVGATAAPRAPTATATSTTNLPPLPQLPPPPRALSISSKG